MRLKRLRCNGWAAGLGIAALVLNALVSVHLAFDLAEALGRSPHSHGNARPHGVEWHLLASLSGHVPHAHDHHKGHAKGHRPDCAVCNSLGSLAGLAAGTRPVLPLPTQADSAPIVAAVAEWHDAAPAAAYRSRAPPLV